MPNDTPNNYPQTCLKCGTLTSDFGDLHCRRTFVDEINNLIWLDKIEEAKILFYSSVFDENWKKSLMTDLGGKLEKMIRKEQQQVENEMVSMEMRRKHQEYIEALGTKYVEPSISTLTKHRTTHCYQCKDELDNSIHLECNICHWIICKCGACGCGYS